MYPPSDPRAGLTAHQAPKPTGPFAPAQAADFSNRPADETSAEYRISYWRARNLIVMVVQLDGHYTLTRSTQPDEYIAFTLDPVTLTVTTADGQQRLPGNRLAILPPGASKITAQGQGTLILLFSPRNIDLAAKCTNNTTFAAPDPHIPAFQPWPDPLGGFRLRSYDLDIPPQTGRFGRIFRCTTMMVNVLDPRVGPRDPAKVSPHHHDDFEQVSLALKGAFRHMLRWPWTPDMAHWRADMAIDLASPSACVIPPPAVHTSLSTDAGENQLVDLFAPPRLDFSLKPGWVLNADEYPLPAYISAKAAS